MELETPTADPMPTGHEDGSDDSDLEEDRPGHDKDKQDNESSEQFLGRVVGAQAATAIGRKPAEHASRFEQRLRDAINRTPRRELDEDSLVVDTNMFSGVIQLMTGARWDALQPNKQFGVNYLRTHAKPALCANVT
jgi:broad specificity phosphatase PhoE